MSLQDRARQARNPQTPGNGIAVAPDAPVGRFDQIGAMLREKQELIVASGLSKVIDPDVFMGRVLAEIRKTPKLAECSTPSLMGAVVSMAQLGLEPGPLGHAYLTPRRNSVNVGGRWEKTWEVVLVVGYRGYIALGRRAGGMSIDADSWRAGDDFTHVRGSEELLTFRKSSTGNRGDVLGYWMAASFDGGKATHSMLNDELEEHAEKYVGRNEPRNGDAKGAFKGFAGQNWDAWCRKTVIRQAVWRLPQSNELARAVQVDEAPTYWQADGTLITATVDGDLTEDNAMAAPPALPQPQQRQQPAQQRPAAQQTQQPVPPVQEGFQEPSEQDLDPAVTGEWK